MAIPRQTALRKRRYRQGKLAKLRVRYQAARSEGERQAILEKVGRVAMWLTPEQFTAPLEKTHTGA